jgi:hypothetical protein
MVAVGGKSKIELLSAAEVGLDPAQCFGVAIGGCVADGSPVRTGHGHWPNSPMHPRWICLARRELLTNDAGQPSAILISLYAWNFTSGRTRDAKWANVLREFGYTEEADAWQTSLSASRELLGSRKVWRIPKRRLVPIIESELERDIERETALKMTTEFDGTLDDYLNVVRAACQS